MIKELKLFTLLILSAILYGCDKKPLLPVAAATITIQPTLNLELNEKTRLEAIVLPIDAV